MKRIEDIVARINTLAERGPFAGFASTRAKAKSRKVTRREFLPVVQNEEDDDFSGYAFHWGGRRELQFNVGFEGERYFRYGVAFSFARTREVDAPVKALSASVDRFNQVARRGKRELSKLRMWRFRDEMRRDERKAGPIPPGWIREGDFVFVGERVRARASGLSEAQLERAVEVLEQLLPVYEAVELSIEPKQALVARICWNTRMWQEPSGRAGKSKAEGTFEKVQGYGHEEWLLNLSTLIGGWKYGFVQAVNWSQKRLEGQRLDLLLYTFESRSKSRYWVAKIKDVEVLSEGEAKRARNEMSRLGLLKAMRAQVSALGLSPKELNTPYPLGIVNLRYKPESVQVIDPPIQFPAIELRSSRYTVMLEVPTSQKQVLGGADEEAAVRTRNQVKLKAKRKAYVAAGDVELVHKQWQEQLRKNLPKLLRDAKVLIEHLVAGHQVDLVIKRNNRTVFFELKTDSVVRQVIRNAVGQLLEYAYWPPGQPRADALIVVGSGKPEATDEDYLQHLRSQLRVPIRYLRYSEGTIDGIVEAMDELAPRQRR